MPCRTLLRIVICASKLYQMGPRLSISIKQTIKIAPNKKTMEANIIKRWETPVAGLNVQDICFYNLNHQVSGSLIFSVINKEDIIFDFIFEEPGPYMIFAREAFLKRFADFGAG